MEKRNRGRGHREKGKEKESQRVRKNERETASRKRPRAASPALGEVNSKLDHVKLPFLWVTTGQIKWQFHSVQPNT